MEILFWRSRRNRLRFLTIELKKLVEDMFESMYEARGVGLAAPQIGISKRLAVIDVTFKEDPDAKLVLANPEILHTEGKHTQPEGCLSIPEFREPVTRPRKVTIRAQDVNGKWYEKTMKKAKNCLPAPSCTKPNT